MTKYLMTEAQRDILMSVTSILSSKATEMLQSLPMVDSEPVAYLAPWHIEPTMHSEADDGLEMVSPAYEGAFPVYTSPQALAKIRAEDVTDETVLVYYADFPYLKDKPVLLQGAKNDLAAAYNLVAAYLVKNRSEER